MRRFVLLGPSLVLAMSCRPVDLLLSPLGSLPSPGVMSQPQPSPPNGQAEPKPVATPPDPVHKPASLRIQVGASFGPLAREDLVALVRFELSGPSIRDGAVLEVRGNDLVDGLAIAKWSDLPAGPIHLKVALFDLEGRIVGAVERDLVVEAGSEAKLDLEATIHSGSMLVRIDPVWPTPPPGGLGILPVGRSPRAWEPFPPIAAPLLAPSAASLPGTVVVGGQESPYLERFDPVSGAWKLWRVPDLASRVTPWRMAAVGDALVFVDDEHEATELSPAQETFVLGPLGEGAGSYTNAGFRLPASRVPRAFAGIGTALGRLLLIGGSSRRRLAAGQEAILTTSRDVEGLSLKTGNWSRLQDMPAARAGAGVVELGGKVYVAGGFTWVGDAATDPLLGSDGVLAGGAKLAVKGSMDAYDPVTDSWAARAAMPTSRHSFGMVACKGRIFAIGGTSDTGRTLGVVESYDPVTDIWRTEPPLSEPRSSPGACVLGDETILAIGGVSSALRPLRTVEAFSPGAGS